MPQGSRTLKPGSPLGVRLSPSPFALISDYEKMQIPSFFGIEV